jgi:hypothetical protein
VTVFTTDPEVIAEHQMHYVGFCRLSCYIHSINGAAYSKLPESYKSIVLTLQTRFFLPLVSILPNFFGIFECGLSLIADILATIITAIFKKKK